MSFLPSFGMLDIAVLSNHLRLTRERHLVGDPYYLYDCPRHAASGP